MSDADIVIKYIEKVGVAPAARDLGLSRPTVYNRLKNPDTVTLKELEIVRGLIAGEEKPEEPATPKWIPVMPEEQSVTAAVNAEPPQSEMRFRPGTPKRQGAPGVTIEELAERVSYLEEYFKVLNQNRKLMAGQETVGEAIPSARPQGFSGPNPMSQLIQQGNPQDRPTPKGLRPDMDSNWNTAKPLVRDNRG